MHSVIMLNVIYAKCHKKAIWAECRYTKCRYAECLGANTVFSVDGIKCFQYYSQHAAFM